MEQSLFLGRSETPSQLQSCLGKNKLMRYPQQLGRSWKVFGYLPQNSPESSAICTTTPWNLISHLPRNLPNLIGHLHRNPLEPRQPSASEFSGTSSAFCAGTLSNLISHLHEKAPEPSGTFSGTWCCSCTGSRRSYSGLKTP